MMSVGTGMMMMMVDEVNGFFFLWLIIIL